MTYAMIAVGIGVLCFVILVVDDWRTRRQYRKRALERLR